MIIVQYFYLFSYFEQEDFMNGKYYQILTYLNTHKEENFSQRDLATALSMSLGSVNSYINQLTAESYLDTDGKLTEKAQDLFIQAKPDNAIILAAGYGMRMVPINTLKPKGLLTIHGKPLIEKTIEDLQAAGICKIYIVVGFLKETSPLFIMKIMPLKIILLL